MRFIYPTLAITCLLVSGCTSSPTRLPASDDNNNEVSARFAKKLNGGSIKFITQKKDGHGSFLQFLHVTMKNCVAEVGDRSIAPNGEISSMQDFVVCDTDFHVGPFKGTVKLSVWGGDRKFTLKFNDKKDSSYDIEAQADLTWDSADKKWTGAGTVDGWYNSGDNDNGVTITIRENLKL